MKVYLEDSVTILATELEQVEEDRKPRSAVIFNLSRLHPKHRSVEHLQIATNILRDKMQGTDGSIYAMPANDIVLICSTTPEKLNEAIFDLRYLFAEDPVAYHHDAANTEFCDHFSLPAQISILRQHCSIRFGLQNIIMPTPAANDGNNRLIPTLSEAVEMALGRIDLDSFLAIRSVHLTANDKMVLQEIHLDLEALQQKLAVYLDIAENYNLFCFIREALDMHLLRKMVELLKARSSYAHYLMLPQSIATLKSQEFMLFDAALPAALRQNIAFALHVGDVYRDLNGFIALRNKLCERGYYLCLDGLSLENVLHVDRQQLGFDLMKLAMPSIHAGDGEWLIEEMIGKVQSLGPSHIIANNCNHDAARRLVRRLEIAMYQE